MLIQEKAKAAVPVADRDHLRRELLRLILKNEAQRKVQAKAR
ncbi:MAG: hypothetical protein WD894_03965 [Pirellulales bacterium]